MFLGGQPAAAPFVFCSKFFTCMYFGYLILIIPFLNFINEITFESIEQIPQSQTTQQRNYENTDIKHITFTSNLGHKLWRPAVKPSKLLPFSTFYTQQQLRKKI